MGAKCIKMEEDIKLMAQKCADSTSESIDIKNENNRLKNEHKIIKKKLDKTQVIQTKLKTKLRDSENECKVLKAQVDTLQRQIRLDKKQNRQKRSEKNTHEVKLNRALSEVKKYKDLAMKYQNQNKDYLNSN